MYTTNSHLKGNKVDDYELTRLQSHTTTWGATVGGPIIKDKLFFFVMVNMKFRWLLALRLWLVLQKTMHGTSLLVQYIALQ